MAMGGDGPWVIAVMWAMTALALVFVILRTCTRLFIVHRFGIDDWVYNASWLFLLLYTIFLTISATFGFGQHIPDLIQQDIMLVVNGLKYELIGQTFAVIGMVLAKASLGFFLINLVVKLWQKIIILAAVILMGIGTAIVAILIWAQYSPVQANYDIRIEGHLNTPITPYSLVLGSLCAFVDFFFAAFPWYFLWSLQMPMREKITIAGSLSLGVLAGICGVYRTVELVGLESKDYLFSTVNLIVWTAAEQAITMVCIGIPVCRPLFRTLFRKRGLGGSYLKQYNSNEAAPGVIVTIGGTGGQKAVPIDPDAAPELNEMDELKLGINGPFTITEAIGNHGHNSYEETLNSCLDSQSSEHALNMNDLESGHSHIHVQRDYKVERS